VAFVRSSLVECARSKELVERIEKTWRYWLAIGSYYD
jgi:hypothetical protein